MSFRSVLSTLLITPALTTSLLAQATQFGNGCVSATSAMPTISLQGAPFANTPLVLDVSGPPGKLAYVMLSFQNQTYANLPLPLDLAAIGNPGCTLLVPPDLAFAVPLNGQGNASITIPALLPANTTLYAQSAILFGQGSSLLDGISEGLQIDMITPTTDPVIGSISQLSGTEGDLLTIRGANFGNGPADNLCMAVMDNTDHIQAFLKVETRNDTEMTASIKVVRPGAVAGNLGFILGSGSNQMLPPVPGASAPQPVWSWRNAAVQPNEMSMSAQTFTPIASLASSQHQCVPCEDGFVWFDVQNGQFTATLPELCDGALFCVYFSEFWWIDNNGDYHRIECQVEQVAICGMTPAARANYLAFMLSINLAADGLSAFAPNANTLTIQANNGAQFSGGSLVMHYKYDAALRVTATDGVCDNFVAPTEPTTVGPNLSAWYTANTPSAPIAVFDTPNADRHFLHTIQIPPGPGTTITGISLHLDLRSNSGLSTNDGISLVVNGGQFVWGLGIANLPEAGGTWTFGQTGEFCLNLADLPASGSGVTSVLAQAIAAGEVDIRIQDDTIVDCVSITVQRCQ